MHLDKINLLQKLSSDYHYKCTREIELYTTHKCLFWRALHFQQPRFLSLSLSHTHTGSLSLSHTQTHNTYKREKERSGGIFVKYYRINILPALPHLPSNRVGAEAWRRDLGEVRQKRNYVFITMCGTFSSKV